MVKIPDGINQFEFVVLSSLRAAQLTRGCTPRIGGTHKNTVMAQMEVAANKVSRALPADLPPLVPPVV